MGDKSICSSKLDGIYDAEVIRTGDHVGRLFVHRKGELLGSMTVQLAYGAYFGPDALDVADWQEWVRNFADGLPSPIHPEAGGEPS